MSDMSFNEKPTLSNQSQAGDNQIEDYVDDYTNQVIGETMKKQLENSPLAGMYMWGNDGMWKY